MFHKVDWGSRRSVMTSCMGHVAQAVLDRTYFALYISVIEFFFSAIYRSTHANFEDDYLENDLIGYKYLGLRIRGGQHAWREKIPVPSKNFTKNSLCSNWHWECDKKAELSYSVEQSYVWFWRPNAIEMVKTGANWPERPLITLFTFKI